MKNKSLMIAAATTMAVATLGVVGAVGVSQVYAQDATDGTAPLIIQNLAKTFGVSEDEVKTVFDNTRDQRQDEHLDELVADGTLTQEQRDALEAKQEEMQTKREEIFNSSMTAEERRTAMQDLHDEMQTWAEDQGIDLPEMGPRGGIRGGMGEGMMDGSGGGFGGGMGRHGGMLE